MLIPFLTPRNNPACPGNPGVRSAPPPHCSPQPGTHNADTVHDPNQQLCLPTACQRICFPLSSAFLASKQAALLGGPESLDPCSQACLACKVHISSKPCLNGAVAALVMAATTPARWPEAPSNAGAVALLMRHCNITV